MEAKNSADNNQSSETSNKAPVFASNIFSDSLSTNTNGKMNGDDKPSGKSFFLRPSALQHHVNLIKEPTMPASTQSDSFKLNPPKLTCPLTESKCFPLEEVLLKADMTKREGAAKEDSSAACNGDSKEVHKDGDDKTSTADTAAGVAGGFVFGSNLADRVVNGQTGEERKEETSMPTFETATAAVTASPETPSLSLKESAAQQQNKDHKVELKEVKIQTGEEGESNVLQVLAKLHSFDKQNQSWVEKGRGWLRLNDMPSTDQASFQSRLVMRAQGSMRVIMNMKLWGGMLVEKVGNKNMKVSAIDPSLGLMVYLITASTNDTAQLYEAVHSRSKQMEGKKRNHQDDQPVVLNKKPKLEATEEESNDSSAPYPETETSNEEASSPTLHSSSSEA